MKLRNHLLGVWVSPAELATLQQIQAFWRQPTLSHTVRLLIQDGYTPEVKALTVTEFETQKEEAPHVVQDIE